MSNRLTFIKWYLLCVSIYSIVCVFNRKPLKILFEHPIFGAEMLKRLTIMIWLVGQLQISLIRSGSGGSGKKLYCFHIPDLNFDLNSSNHKCCLVIFRL